MTSIVRRALGPTGILYSNEFIKLQKAIKTIEDDKNTPTKEFFEWIITLNEDIIDTYILTQFTTHVPDGYIFTMDYTKCLEILNNILRVYREKYRPIIKTDIALSKNESTELDIVNILSIYENNIRLLNIFITKCQASLTA